MEIGVVRFEIWDLGRLFGRIWLFFQQPQMFCRGVEGLRIKKKARD